MSDSSSTELNYVGTLWSIPSRVHCVALYGAGTADVYHVYCYCLLFGFGLAMFRSDVIFCFMSN